MHATQQSKRSPKQESLNEVVGKLAARWRRAGGAVLQAPARLLHLIGRKWLLQRNLTGNLTKR